MGPLASLFDTNILIDLLNGVAAAKEEIIRYQTSSISVISWMEVMAGATRGEEEAFTRLFLARFHLLQITPAIAERAVFNRQTSRLKLPEAVILATAQVENCLLITRNTRDFHESQGGVRIPYRL